MKRTTTRGFGWPAHPTPRPEQGRLRRVLARLRVSLRAFPGRTRNLCAPNRTARKARTGGVIAAGAFFIMLPISLPSLAQDDEANGKPDQRPPCLPRVNAGPEMVLIAAGQFEMGSDEQEEGRYDNEGPQHTVTIPKPFAIGRCEVTVGEFRQFVDATGYQTDAEKSGGCFAWKESEGKWLQDAARHWRNPGFEQTDQHPVVCVSWNDAQAYIQWLNSYLKIPSNPYRLPSETEWEYVARAGTTSAFFWGDVEQCEYANGADKSAQESGEFSENWIYATCEDGFVYTAPVASYKPNPWNTYDLSGNVWEWVEDCWHESYENAPSDGSPWLEGNEGDCDRRALRGGSWFYFPRILRSAYRYWLARDVAFSFVGFRLARAL